MPPSTTSNIFSQPVDQQALNLTHAIALAETGTNGKPNYNAAGDNGTSHGAYQWQPGNFAAAAKQFGLDPNDLSPENQDKVAYAQVKSYKDQGLSPAQIASMWNSGQPNNYVNHSGTTTINGKPISYDTPAYVGKVKANYLNLIGKGGGNSVSNTSAATPDSTNSATGSVAAQRAALQKAGLPVSVNPDKAQPTFAGSLFRGLLRPVARAVDTVAEPVAKALGDKNPDMYDPYLGDVSGFGQKTGETTTERLKDIGGGALEIGALAIPGIGEAGDAAVDGGEAAAEAANTAKTVSTLGKAASAAKEGAAIGSLGSAGNTLDTNNDATVGDVAASAGEGAVGGAVLGGASSLIGSGLSKLNPVTNPTLEDVNNARAGVESAYQKTFNMTPTQMAKEAATKARTGSNFFSTLAKYVPDVTDGKGNIDLAKANEALGSASDQFKSVIQKAADKETTIFNLDDIKESASSRIDSNVKSSTGRSQALNKVNSEITSLQDEHPEYFSKITRDGKEVTGINAKGAESLRQAGNSFTPFNASDPERIGASAGNALASSVRDQVEKEGTFPAYRQANKEWGQIIDTQQKLQKYADSGKKFRVPGGLAGSIARKVASGVIGFSTAGYPGLVLGELGSEYGAKVLADPALRTIFERAVLNKSDESDIPEIVSNLKSQVDAYEKTQAGLPRLPAPKTTVPQTILDNDGIVRHTTTGPTIPLDAHYSPDVNQVQVKTGPLPLGEGRVEAPDAQRNVDAAPIQKQTNTIKSSSNMPSILPPEDEKGQANIGALLKGSAASGAAALGLGLVKKSGIGTGTYKAPTLPTVKKSSIPKSTPALKIAAAIANNETGVEKNPYSFHQPSGVKALGNALGKYQITSAELKEKSKQFLGKSVSDRTFLNSPSLQDKFEEAKIRWLQSKGYSDEEVIAANRGGFSNFSKKSDIVNKYKDYVAKGIAFLESNNKKS